MASDPLPEWTISLTDSVWKARTLRDFGIWPLKKVRLIGRCSWHGHQEIVVETTDMLGDDLISGYIECQGTHDGKRWLPIIEFVLMTEGK